MDLATRLIELQRRTIDHRKLLLTEEAAKTALVTPFLQALGYDVFNPGEVVPEFTADMGTKRGEKVDYAICASGKVTILVECKPSTVQLNLNHANQLYRYFSVTDARLAVLTNGVMYQFYSDIDHSNKMDDTPFFTFSMDEIKPGDVKTLEKFAKATFDIDKIVQEAGNLKLQSLLRHELDREFAEPLEEFVRLMATRVHGGRLTPAIKEIFGKLLVGSISNYIRDLVNERLSSALKASSPVEDETADDDDTGSEDGIVTTQEEISGFHIVQAIASRLVDPKRVIMRDAKSYCAILLDDNNRKTITRLHFNGMTTKYLGIFTAKDERKQLLSELTEIYQHAPNIEARLRELDPSIAG